MEIEIIGAKPSGGPDSMAPPETLEALYARTSSDYMRGFKDGKAALTPAPTQGDDIPRLLNEAVALMGEPTEDGLHIMRAEAKIGKVLSLLRAKTPAPIDDLFEPSLKAAEKIFEIVFADKKVFASMDRHTAAKAVELIFLRHLRDKGHLQTPVPKVKP